MMLLFQHYTTTQVSGLNMVHIAECRLLNVHHISKLLSIYEIHTKKYIIIVTELFVGKNVLPYGLNILTYNDIFCLLIQSATVVCPVTAGHCNL